MRAKYQTIIIACSCFIVSKFVSCENNCDERMDCFAFYNKFYVPLNSKCDDMIEMHEKMIRDLQNFAALDKRLNFYKKLNSVTTLYRQMSEFKMNYTDGVEPQSFDEITQRINNITGHVNTIKALKWTEEKAKEEIQRNIRNKLNEVQELNRTLETLKLTIDELGADVETLSSSQIRWCEILKEENEELNKLQFDINRTQMKLKKKG